ALAGQRLKGQADHTAVASPTGAVVGGTGTGNPSSGSYPPGSSRQQILTYAPLPGTTDVTRTEVYVYPPRSAYLIA
ncbi:MAG: hypothetical protein JXA67_11305, partial [Micromonosporaceae bacterium]|nr:hypothetical protein [Micromonosporaceae bacterium]